MTANLKEMLKIAKREISLINCYWQAHRVWFQERDPVLFQNFHPLPWAIIEHSLFDSLVITIDRLLDPAITGGRFENISLDGLVKQVQQEYDKYLAIDLNSSLPVINELKFRRGNYFAHNDLETLLNPKEIGKRLPVEILSQLIESLNEIFNQIQKEAGEVETNYDFITAASNNLESLIRMVELVNMQIDETDPE